MSEAVRVLLVAPMEKPGFTGGQARAGRILADALQARGDVVLTHVIIPHREEAGNVLWRFGLKMGFYFRLTTALVVERPSVGHFFSPCSLTGLLEKTMLALLARAFGLQVLLNLRNDPRALLQASNRLESKVSSWCIRRFHGVIAQFNGLKGFYEEFSGVSSRRIFVVHNAVTSRGDIPDSDLVRRRYRGKRLLFLGSLQQRKGLDVVLEAFSMLPSKWEFHLDIVGDPQPHSFMAELVSQVRVNGLEGKVTFHGARFGAEKDRILMSAALLVLPSRAEGFPNVALEAGQVGVPVLLSSVGASVDISEAFGAGSIVVEGREAADWARAIETALESEDGYLGRAFDAVDGAGRFTVDSMCDSLVRAYRSCLSGSFVQG